MKRFIFLFLTSLILSIFSFSQGVIILKKGDFNYTKNIDKTLWNRLLRNSTFKEMDSSLQWSYYWLNLMRRSPSNFFKTYVASFLEQFPDAVSGYSNSLKTDMEAIDSLTFLFPDPPLEKVAYEYGSDILEHSLNLNHKNSLGEDFAKRVSKTTGLRCAAENVYKGSEDPLQALILLLIDHNVSNVGHRKNLLDPNFNVAGLSFFTRGREDSIMVQEFGCR